MTCAPWPVVWPNELDTTTIPADAITAAVQGASDVLWALTGRVYGTCSATEMFRVPGGSGCVGPYLGRDGRWRNAVAGACCALPLSYQPVQSVTQVRLDGSTVTDWFLQRGKVVRDGACWPSVPDYDPPNIQVTYAYGAGVPAGVGPAVGELATEMLAPFRGRECRLPGKTTVVMRNGVTVTQIDMTTLTTLGLTGLPVSDVLIRALNPSGLRQPSRVFAVDGARRG
jgi:hypothetical protein